MKRKTTQKKFTLLFVSSILNTSAENNNNKVKRLTYKSKTTKTILAVDILGKPPENQVVSLINNHAFFNMVMKVNRKYRLLHVDRTMRINLKVA
ncbi:hypothetical protein QWY81_13505 [Polaribacter undariae]|uniref:Uncharacterized protein n=1 Tax=Polaribacter sejongensis TaxID=985043 RepID=A0AAJ1QYX6_9FLAO|nr:hypothetical protein [Polaribacter undariae]MDN3620478.1 hypothetical protein [Polaribacter undariae]UWD33346.1 hypothetical protein NQP51_06605 [Polaribacter undariae]